MVSFLPPTRNTTAPSSSSYGQQHQQHDDGGDDDSDRQKLPPPPSTATTTTSDVAEVMLLLDGIVNLNNIAAHEMLLFVNNNNGNGGGGNRGKALKLLSGALKRTGCFVNSFKKKKTKTMTTAEEEEDETGVVTAISGTNSTNQISCSFLMPSSTTTTTTTRRQLRIDGDQDDDRQCALFKYPIQIDLNTTAAATTSTIDCDVVAETLPYVIVYNLALWHHLAGLQQEEEALCSKRYNHMKKAIALYDQVRRIVFTPKYHHHHGIGVGGDMPLLLHKVAICNNLGHAHQVMGNIKMSKNWFRQLLIVGRTATTAFSSTPSSVRQQQETEEEPSSIIMDGFLWKAFYQVFGNIPSSSVAAAG